MHQSESALKTYRKEPLGQEVNHDRFSKFRHLPKATSVIAGLEGELKH